MQAIIASCCSCFYGRTLAVISMSCESCDNDATRGFGLLLLGHIKVDFSDANALKKIFKGLDSTKIYDQVIDLVLYPNIEINYLICIIHRMLHAFFCNPSKLHQNCRGKCIDYSMFLLFIIVENGD